MSKTALISYFFANDALPLGDSLARGLVSQGWRVERFHCQAESRVANTVFKPMRKLAKLAGASWDPAKHFGLDNESFRDARLQERLQALRPELLIVVRGPGYDPEVLRTAKREGWIKTTVGWWVGNPQTTSFLESETAHYDAYFSIHPEPQLSSVRHLDLLAFDGEIYRPLPGTPKDVPISFVGGTNPRRQAVFSRLTDFPIAIYGPGWHKLKNGWNPALWRCVKARGIYGDALNLLYNRSKIVLNVTGWEPTSGRGLNLRVLDVPATGAFLLTDWNEGLADMFRLGVEIETWRNVEELRDKIAFYLANDAARERIATAGLERARRFENYAMKMARLLRETGFQN